MLSWRPITGRRYPVFVFLYTLVGDYFVGDTYPLNALVHYLRARYRSTLKPRMRGI